MTKPVQIINDYWLKEIILNGNPDLNKFYKDDLIKMINILKYENQKYIKVFEKIQRYIKPFYIKRGYCSAKEILTFLDSLKEEKYE